MSTLKGRVVPPTRRAAERKALLSHRQGAWDLTADPNFHGSSAQRSELTGFLADARATLGGIAEVAGVTGVGAARNAISVAGIGAQVEQLHSEIETIAQALVEMRSGADESARAAGMSSELAEHLSRQSEEGLAIVREAIESIHRMEQEIAATSERVQHLSDRVRKIGTVSQMIEDVAARTNLLALNAAIEAARAGERGRTFAVVAEEVRKLAESTAGQTQRITELISETVADLGSVQRATGDAQESAAHGVQSAAAANESLERIHSVVLASTEPAARVASASEEQRASVERVTQNVDRTSSSAAIVQSHTTHVADESFAISARSEATYAELSRFHLGGFVDQAADSAFDVAERATAAFEAAIDAGRTTLDCVLDPRYEEIRGATIARLGYLFNTSRVPEEGFDPPKYLSGYDEAVDGDLVKVIDEVSASDGRYVFAILVDLNSLLVMHSPAFRKDWSGDPAVDQASNRVKRFFLENKVLLAGARHGLGRDLPAEPLSRAQLSAAGCNLSAPDSTTRDYLLQTYARDDGEVFSMLAVPVYVKGKRWGAALVAWKAD